MNLTLKVWRQKSVHDDGLIETYQAKDIPIEASFLEMLDIVNQRVILDGGEPIHFDYDCREGICGQCSLTINGIPHSKERGVTACQLHMRKFKDGDTIWVEPFRAKAFPLQRDLMVDRSAFDRIIAAGGFIDVRTGSAQDANNLPVAKTRADSAMDAAACIGCGACVAACKTQAPCSLSQPRLPTSTCYHKEHLKKTSVCLAWCARWTLKVLVTAPISTSVRLFARRKSALKT